MKSRFVSMTMMMMGALVVGAGCMAGSAEPTASEETLVTVVTDEPGRVAVRMDEGSWLSWDADEAMVDWSIQGLSSSTPTDEVLTAGDAAATLRELASIPRPAMPEAAAGITCEPYIGCEQTRYLGNCCVYLRADCSAVAGCTGAAY